MLTIFPSNYTFPRYYRANSVRHATSTCEGVCLLNHYCAITRLDYREFRSCLETAAKALASKNASPAGLLGPSFALNRLLIATVPAALLLLSLFASSTISSLEVVRIAFAGPCMGLLRSVAFIVSCWRFAAGCWMMAIGHVTLLLACIGAIRDAAFVPLVSAFSCTFLCLSQRWPAKVGSAGMMRQLRASTVNGMNEKDTCIAFSLK